MASKIKKILFYSDGARGELNALNRAHAFAGTVGAELLVMGVVKEVSTSDVRLRKSISQIQKTLIHERGIELDGLIAGIKADKANRVSVKKLVVPGKDYLEVIRQATSGKTDLIIKSVNSKTAISNALFGNTDIRLMHFSPCPVMVLKPSRRGSMKSVAVAVDPTMESVEVANLNSRLLETGVYVSEAEGGELHLLHVLEHPLEEEKSANKDAYKNLEKSLKADLERRLEKLAEDISSLNVVDHVLKGKPDSAIAKFVAKNDIDLLVMGSVARSGLPGLLVGNTAERIVNQVDCSVLVVKPDGWKTPGL
ncbi:MAG: universal stress protein [Proteobacteria bacterium]|nr:universal stress protein [Pseudomonadota bacterium]